MKRAQQLLVGFLALLLIGTGWWAVARINSLEARVQQLEASKDELRSSHRKLAEALLRGSPEEAALAKVEMIRELAGLPPPESWSSRSSHTSAEVNSPPRNIGSK
jgi:hypothetical protein